MSDSLDNFVRDAFQQLDGEDAAVSAAAKPSGAASLGELPGHEVEDFIARGGMGAVYRARQVALEREVAVKVMTRKADSPEMAERFRREALVLGKLAHPNIVPVYNIGHDEDGQLYYTMKLVKGRTLQHILNDLRNENAETLQQHTLASLLTIFRKVCDALAFAHSQGVLHRDLKPENIMVGEFGEVLVMDWGLAKIQDKKRARPGECETSDSDTSLSSCFPVSESCATLQGSVMGTPQYMSPEQARGEIDELDARSDVFSLGGILYAILTLRPPVEGKTLDEVLEKVRAGHITPPTAYGAATASKGATMAKGEVLEARKITPLPHLTGGRVPVALSAVAMKALRAEKDHRYPTVSELSADIESFQAGFATKAEKAGLATQLVLLVKRHKGMVATTAIAAILLTVLGVWFVWNLRAKEQRAIAGEQAAVKEKEAARRSAAKSSLSLAEASMREANGLTMRTALNDVPEDLRDSTWTYLQAQSDSSLAQIHVDEGVIVGLAADPTRPGVFAVVDQNQKVTIMNVRTGQRLLEFTLALEKTANSKRCHLAFSPDGQHIAAALAGVRRIVIHRASDGTNERAWSAPPTEHLEYGREDALLRSGGASVQLWNPITGKLTWQEDVKKGAAARAVFLPGGGELLTYSSNKKLRVLKASDGNVIRDLGGRAAVYDWFMAVRPDGKVAITIDETQVMECVSLEDGRVLFTLPEKKPRQHATFSRDGSLLFTAALLPQGVQLIEVWNSETGEFIRSVLGGRGAIQDVIMHPLTNELVVTGGESRVWDPVGPTASRSFVSLPSGNVSFWGPEDWMFGWLAVPTQWALYRVNAEATDLVWQPEKDIAYLAESSADGNVAAMVHAGFENEIIILNKTAQGVMLAGSVEASFTPYRLRLSPTGKRIACMERTKNLGFQLFDVAAGEAIQLETLKVRHINDAGWLDEHRLLALLTLEADRGAEGSQEALVVWNADTGKVLKRVMQPTAMDALAIAPGGREFAEAGADQHIRIRDASTLAVLKEFRAHNAQINALAWHPTKSMLASGSEDYSVKTWDLDTLKCITEYRDLRNPPTHVAFSPSGKFLGAKTFKDEIVRLWQLDGDPLLEGTKRVAAPLSSAVVWEDLLTALTPEMVAQTGNGWRLESGALYSPGKENATVTLPGSFVGTSYQLHVKLRMLRYKGTFNITLPVASQMADFRLDGWWGNDGWITGFGRVYGNQLPAQSNPLRGRQISDLEPHELVISVRLVPAKAKITVTLDGRSFYEMNVSPAAFSQEVAWATRTPGCFSLGARGENWMVTEVKVRRLAAGE